jgi:hypothetical protein
MSSLHLVDGQLIHPQRVSAITVTRIPPVPRVALVDDETGAAMELRNSVYWPKVERDENRRGRPSESVDPAEDLRCWENVTRPVFVVMVLLSGGGQVEVRRLLAEGWLDKQLLDAYEQCTSTQRRVAAQLGLDIEHRPVDRGPLEGAIDG